MYPPIGTPTAEDLAQAQPCGRKTKCSRRGRSMTTLEKKLKDCNVSFYNLRPGEALPDLEKNQNGRFTNLKFFIFN